MYDWSLQHLFPLTLSLATLVPYSLVPVAMLFHLCLLPVRMCSAKYVSALTLSLLSPVCQLLALGTYSHIRFMLVCFIHTYSEHNYYKREGCKCSDILYITL
jgi:hypothetical protein